MIVLVIGASGESVYAINLARKKGHYVIAFDGDEMAEGLKYANESHVTDIRKPENIYRLLGERKPDIVLPTPIGRILTITGKVNDYYKLMGVTARSADICTDKYLFHQELAKGGLRSGKCVLIETEKDVEGWNEFPAILKPRFGAGSRNVYALANEDSLNEVMNALAKDISYENYVLESMVQGQEYGIDGMCVNGEVYPILLRRKLLTPPPARQCVGYISVTYDEFSAEQWSNLKDKLTKIMGRLGIKDSVFHGDLIYTKDDFFPIEISARPSGHQLHNVFTPLATGVSTLEQYLRMGAGKAPKLEELTVKKAMIRYFDFEDCRVVEVPDKNDLLGRYPLLEYHCNIAPRDKMGRVVDGHSIMGRGYFVLEGSSDEELKETADRLLGEFRTVLLEE